LGIDESGYQGIGVSGTRISGYQGIRDKKPVPGIPPSLKLRRTGGYRVSGFKDKVKRKKYLVFSDSRFHGNDDV